MSETIIETTPEPTLPADNITKTTIVEVEKNPYNVIIGKLLLLIGKVDSYTDSLIKPEPKTAADLFKEMLSLKAETPDLSYETVNQIIQKNEPSLSPAGALAIATVGCASLGIYSRIIDTKKLSNESIGKDKFHQNLLKHSLHVCSKIDAFENISDATATDIEGAFSQMSILIDNHQEPYYV